MSKQLEEIKRIFITADDVDEETRQHNLKRVEAWQDTLIKSENFLNWQEHDVTREIVQQAKETYKDAFMRLGRERSLTEKERMSLYALQDATLWIISLAEKDAKGTIEQIHKEIAANLHAV